MRRDRFARLIGVLSFGVALGTGSCSDSPGDLFGPRGGAGGAKGGAAGASGGTDVGGNSAGVGGDGGHDDGLGGTISSGGAPLLEGGHATSGGASAGSGGAPAEGGSAGATSGGKAGGGNLPNEIVQQIIKNTDDCTWILVNGSYQERLRFSEMNPWLEVGSDTEQGRIGLRFVLPIPPKATIVAASIQLQRVDGNAAASNTLTIQVFDTGNVPSFDASHMHGPRDHVSMAGLYATAVRGTMVGEKGKEITTADLKVLVQRVVDRADFVQNSGTIGFVISPDNVREWAAYGDSSAGLGATLRVSYRLP